MKRKNKNRRGKSNIEKKTQAQQLYRDLITEIFLRLPVKSLVRFKCLCKSWLSLISDSYFATSHFQLTTAARTHSHRVVLITDSAHPTRSIDFEASLNDDAAIASLKLDFLLPQSYSDINIGGSCRGFLFLYCDDDIYLWNPSTGVHKQIPSSPILSSVDNSYVTYLYGFGYNPSTDDYFVVLGSYEYDDDDTHFEFFSLRANIWNEIEGAYLPYFDAIDHNVGTLFNGAIHWFAQRVDTSVKVIVSFDLIERRLSDIALPGRFGSYDPIIFCGLWVFGGFMSVWAMEDNEIHIWLMQEYQVSSSWTKILVLSRDEELGVNFYPICSTNYGHIVGFNGTSALVKYSDNGELLEHRNYCNHVFRVSFYTETLLPLPLPRDTQQV